MSNWPCKRSVAYRLLAFLLPFLINMNKKHHHHVVPKCILKHFTDEHGLLHCYDKRSDKLYRSSPRNAFKQRDMYAYTYPDGKKDLSLEDWFGEHLENDFGPLAEKLLALVRRRRKGHGRRSTIADLSEEELEIARHFCIFQFARTPARFKKAMAELDSSLDGYINEAARMKRQRNKDVSEEELAREVADARRQANQPHYKRNIWLKSLSTMLEGEGYKVSQSKGLVVGAIKNSRQQTLIIGDNPIIQALPGGVHLSDPLAELIMPIASDAAISLVRTPRCKRYWLFGRQVEEFNQYVLNRSEVIASRSESLTLRLANDYRTSQTTGA